MHLIDPRATKQVSGRKSDVLDCQWIWQLMSYGLLSSAFRPADEICELRTYTRVRSTLINDQTRTIQRMQKALVQMNLTLLNHGAQRHYRYHGYAHATGDRWR